MSGSERERWLGVWCRTDFEVVDRDEVGKEGQNVLNVEEVTLLEELHRLPNVLFLLNHVARCKILKRKHSKIRQQVTST